MVANTVELTNSPTKGNNYEQGSVLPFGTAKPACPSSPTLLQISNEGAFRAAVSLKAALNPAYSTSYCQNISNKCWLHTARCEHL
jgi:hypothetical protein